MAKDSKPALIIGRKENVVFMVDAEKSGEELETKAEKREKSGQLAPGGDGGAGYFVAQGPAVVVSRHAVAYLVDRHAGGHR